MLFWMILGVMIWLLIRNWTGGKFGAPPGFNDLINKVKTDENKHQIEHLVEFHKTRCDAGADVRMSSERMMSDLKKLGKTKEEEPS